MNGDRFDIVICGGGLAGLTVALQLKQSRPERSILVLERKLGPLPAGVHKVGESTTEGGTYLLREIIGLRDYIAATHVKKLGLRFFGGCTPEAPFDQRWEVGDTLFARNASYQVDRGLLENDLRAFCRQAGVVLEEGAVVNDVHFGADVHAVEYRSPHRDGLTRTTCRWLVDASGRRRLLQSKLGLAQSLAHNGSACWWRSDGEIDVANLVPAERLDWHERVGPKRWYSTNHLFGPGYFVWLIPLCSGMTSIGIVADEAMHPLAERNTLQKARDWLRAHEPHLYAVIRPEGVRDFRLLKQFAYTTSRAFSAERWSCVGEAAAFTDPLYSMGTDLIAIGNRITTRLIELDEAGTQAASITDAYNAFYLDLVATMSELFADMYPVFGRDRVVILKVIWDIGCYWGFFSQLTIQPFLEEPALLPELHALCNRVRGANRKVQSALRMRAGSGDDEPLPPGFYQFGGLAEVTALRAAVTEPKELTQVAANVGFLEGLAAAFELELLDGRAGEQDPGHAIDAAMQDDALREQLRAYLRPLACGAMLASAHGAE